MGKIISALRSFFGAAALAGCIMLVIGMYYLIFRAGIPYQDPTVEMQIQYAVNYTVGEVLCSIGAAFAAVGGIARLIIRLCAKK